MGPGRLSSATGASVGDVSCRDARQRRSTFGTGAGTESRGGRLGVLAGPEMPAETPSIPDFAPASFPTRRGALAVGRESSKPVAAAAVAAASAAQAAAAATRRLVEAYKQLREENRKLYFMAQRMRTACILLLALSALSWFLRPTGRPFIGGEGFIYNVISWLYVGILTCAGWCLYSLCDWRSTQVEVVVPPLPDLSHPLLPASNAHQQQSELGAFRVDGRGDVRVAVRGDECSKSGTEYLSTSATAAPADHVEQRGSVDKDVSTPQGGGDQEERATTTFVEDLDVERIPVSAETPPPPPNEWPQGPVLLRATEEQWIVERVRALAAKEKKKRVASTEEVRT